MKKYVLCIIALSFIVLFTGCKKEEIVIVQEELTNNTMLVKKNGELQVAIMEEFDKDYYRISELSQFIKEKVDVYNIKAGSEEITVENVMKNNAGKAMMVLNYTGMAHYSAFNQVLAASFSAAAENITIQLPDKLLGAKDNVSVDTNNALGNSKYRVLVLYEPFEIKVNGDIKYYSDNLKLVDNNTVKDIGLDQAGEEQSSATNNDVRVVIYKPF